MAYRDSDPVTGMLALQGTWLQGCDDPAGTIRSYPYGRSARSRNVDTMGTSAYYVGRSYPVVDYGEHEDDSLSVTIHIPHGPTYAADVDGIRALVNGRTVLLYRDNRGRVLPGVASAYREQDQDWGSAVTFTFTRVDSPPTEMVTT